MMYFGVKAWGFQGFLGLGLGKSKNLNFLSFENIEAFCGLRRNVNSLLASLVMLVPSLIQFSVLFWVLMGDISKRMIF